CGRAVEPTSARQALGAARGPEALCRPRVRARRRGIDRGLPDVDEGGRRPQDDLRRRHPGSGGDRAPRDGHALGRSQDLQLRVWPWLQAFRPAYLLGGFSIGTFTAMLLPSRTRPSVAVLPIGASEIM